MKKTLFTLLLVVCLGTLAFGQASLTSTTLSLAITDASSTTLSVTSATSWNASTSQQTYYAYVDRELMKVLAVSGTQITVLRGANGSKAALHLSGSLIYTAPAQYFTVADKQGSSCTATKEIALPQIAVSTGNIWDCRAISSTISTWVLIGNGTGTSSGMQTFRAACTGTVGSAETEFLNTAACSGATAATVRFVASSYQRLSGLYVTAGTAPGTSKTDTLTVMKNGSATTITCAVAGTATTCNDTSNAAVLAPGDYVTIRLATATSGAGANYSVSLGAQ